MTEADIGAAPPPPVSWRARQEHIEAFEAKLREAFELIARAHDAADHAANAIAAFSEVEDYEVCVEMVLRRLRQLSFTVRQSVNVILDRNHHPDAAQASPASPGYRI